MRRASACFAVCLALWGAGRAPAEPIRRFVLAAGANNGGVERELLRYAVSDAEGFARVMQEMGGVDAADCVLLRDPDLPTFAAGLETVRQRVGAARRWGAGRLELVLYYSGHADDGGLLLAGQRQPYAWLRDYLDTVEADVRIAILDACASGNITRQKGGFRQSPFLVDESSSMRGRAFLTSSSDNEAAQESDELGASFFTHYLVSGLRGAADVSQDGRVTLTEAYHFAFDETLARTTGTRGGTQHPSRDITMTGTGDVVLTDLRQTTAGLTLDASLGGRFFVRNGDGLLLAETAKPAGRPMELGLAPGTYTVHWLDGDRLSAARSSVVAGQRLRLAAAAFAPVDLEVTRYRGDPWAAASAADAEGLDSGTSGRRHAISLRLLFNYQEESFRGLQAAWLVNQARQAAGAQLSGIGNLAQGELRGWQAAGMVNWAVGPLQGTQVAGAVNIGRQVRGWQASGSTNVAQSLSGGQLALGANLAREARGLQLGLVNAADRMIGWQVGLVNVSGDIDGVSLGLVNYSHTGLFNLGIGADELGFACMTLRSGSRPFYTSFSIGRGGQLEGGLTAVGMGLGSHRDWPWGYAELEAEHLAISAGLQSDRNQLTRLRLNLGRQLDPHLSLYAGVSVNQLVRQDDPILVGPWGKPWLKVADSVVYWPGVTVGVRLGRQ